MLSHLLNFKMECFCVSFLSCALFWAAGPGRISHGSINSVRLKDQSIVYHRVRCLIFNLVFFFLIAPTI